MSHRRELDLLEGLEHLLLRDHHAEVVGEVGQHAATQRKGAAAQLQPRHCHALRPVLFAEGVECIAAH